jgi:hypothetical protein
MIFLAVAAPTPGRDSSSLCDDVFRSIAAAFALAAAGVF